MPTEVELDQLAETDAADAVERARKWERKMAMPLTGDRADETAVKKRVAQSRAEEWSDDDWLAYRDFLVEYMRTGDVALMELLSPNAGWVRDNWFALDRKRWERTGDDDASGPFGGTEPESGWRLRD